MLVEVLKVSHRNILPRPSHTGAPLGSDSGWFSHSVDSDEDVMLI